MLEKTIDSWRVVMTTNAGETLMLEDVPDEACRMIDEAIKDQYDVTWEECANAEDSLTLDTVLEWIAKNCTIPGRI